MPFEVSTMENASCAECGTARLILTVSDTVCGDCGLVQRDAGPPVSEEVFRYPDAFDVVYPEGPAPGVQRRREPGGGRRRTRPPGPRTSKGCATVHKRRTGMTIEEHGRTIMELLHLPEDLIREALGAYKQATPHPYKDHKRMARMVACIHATCRRRSATRTFKELARASGVPRRDIIREAGAMRSSHRALHDGGSRSWAGSVAEMIGRCAAQVAGLDAGAVRHVVAVAKDQLYRMADSIHLQGKSPCTVAGVFIFKALRSTPGGAAGGVSLDDVCAAVGVRKGTAKELLKKLEQQR